MTKVYKFDPKHFFYVGEVQPQLDPFTKEPLLPGANHASRTTVEPPEVEEGKARVFDKDTQTWSQVDNFHDTTVYSTATGQEVVLKLGSKPYTELGPIPEGYTTEARPSEWHRWVDGAWVEDTEAKNAYEAEDQRKQGLEDDTESAALEAILKSKTNAEIDTIWDGATANQKDKYMKALFKIVARRLS